MLPSEDESMDDPIRLSYYEQDRVLRYSDISNLTIDACTIEDPGLIDISSEDSGNDIQQERITLSSGAGQLLKEDSALNKEVMDREKQTKFKNRKTNSSDTNKKNNVDFKNNTGLIGMKISQGDVIVDDVPDVNQNAINKKIKNKAIDPSSVKVVLELDVYERIIGKAYDNIKTYGNLQPAGTANSLSNNSNADLKNASKSANNTSKASIQTCHKPLEEVSVYKIIDSKRPKRVCRSKSLYIPSVQKTIESEKNVLLISKTRNITKEVNFKGLDDNNLHYSKITTKELTRNQNLKTNSSDKSRSMMIHEMSTPIITQAAKSEDAKITGQCGNVGVKPLIHIRKNVNINIYDHVSSEASKIIKPTDTKKICKRPKRVCRSKSLYIPSVQKTIESEKNVLLISKTRNITKEVNFKGLDDNNLHYSKITTKELTRNQNLKTNSSDKSRSMMIHEMSTPIITQAAKSEDAKITGQCGNVSVKPLIHIGKNVNINIYDHVSSEASKIIKPTDTKKICKSTHDQVINQVAPKASILKNRRNTISSAGQITKSTNSEKVTKVKRKNGVPNYNDQITKLNLFDKMTKPATCDNARNMKIKNDNINCNDQFKILKDATITKLINNEKAFEQTKDKINAIINTKINSPITTSSVDTNNKTCDSEKPIHMKRKVINIIDDQVLTSFVPKLAASISNKRRNTVSSICPENTTSLKVCSKSIFSDAKIIPHYHTCLRGNETGNKDKNDKTDADTKRIPVKLTHVKSPLEVNPEKTPETITERNENNCKPCKDNNNTEPLSQIKPSAPVIINKNNIVIEPTEPNINFSHNTLPTVLPKPKMSECPKCPKFDPKIKEKVSNTPNKDINIPDRLNTQKNTEHFLRTFDSVPRETIPVLLNMAPYPNQRSCKNYTSSFPIQSIASNRPLQEFQTNICLSPRTSHTAFPRSHRIRPWWAPYPSNYNQFNSVPNNQYPIFNRLMNAGTFAKNSYISRMATRPPKFQHSPRPSLPPYSPNAPCLPINISNTSPKDVHPVVNKDRKETSSSKIKNPSNEAPAVENTLNGKKVNSSVNNAKISEAKTVDISPVKRSLTENINILNNTKEITHIKEQKSKLKDCNEAKKPSEKTYSPAILPILSFPEICDILLETPGYDYPNLKKTSNNRTEWINTDAFDRSDLDIKKKRKMNDVITPDNKKGKISISEYKKRLVVTTTS